MRRGRFKRTCWRLAYQIPLAILTALGFVVIIMHSGDRRVLQPEEIAAAGFGYNLTLFEAKHLPAKWVHRVYTALPWIESPDDFRSNLLERYPNLAREIRSSRHEFELALAQGDVEATKIEEAKVDALLAERNDMRDAFEEFLESEISSELVRLNLNWSDEFIWPPVDFRIDDTPHVLVTSPREAIERDSVRLLEPEIAELDKQTIENNVLRLANLSAVVLPTGGLASYPNVVPSHYGLLPLLEVAAHEWLHAYLIFHPLGRAYWSNPDMTSLNETLANRFGQEVGRAVYNRLTGEKVPTLEPPFVPQDDSEDDLEPDRFDAREYLHETRREAEDMLDEGRIEEAEAYMEERRQTLVENGHNIRKINQAYFAFHGTYADSPSSTSPLARQIWDLRQTTSDVGELVKTLQTLSNYNDFQTLLKTHAIE